MGLPQALKSQIENLFCHNEDPIGRGLRDAKTVVFSQVQANVFLDAALEYEEQLDFMLPFPSTFLQFSEPVTVFSPEKGHVGLSCMLLYQDAAIHVILSWFLSKDEGWLEMADILEQGERVARSEPIVERRTVVGLAKACIGYINCENIYLYKEGEVPDKVNRKRAQQGKKILEPYYVCRIRGVQYDSNGNATGEGTHHGFRYDVRGHFRRLTNGKTTWVRPHQRGLQNELYIPKTYVIEQGAKQVSL